MSSFRRHGQYNLDGESDCDRTLTKLGEVQAAATGKRLKELGIKFNSLFVSNMSRALQTSEIIKQELFKDCDLSFESDPLLREGPPCQPEPPVSHWKPELYVSYLQLSSNLKHFKEQKNYSSSYCTNGRADRQTHGHKRRSHKSIPVECLISGSYKLQH